MEETLGVSPEETVEIINDIRSSIQDAYSIKAVLNRLSGLNVEYSQETKQLYWNMIEECADCIRARLEKYSCGFVPEDPFDGIEDISSGIEYNMDIGKID